MSGRPATDRIIRGRAAISVNDPGHVLPAGWTRAILTDVADLGTGHTPSRNYPEYWNGEIPWIGIRDAGAHHGGVINDTAQRITPLGVENSAARILRKDTVCLSRTASVGYVVKMGRDMTTSQDFVTWSCSEALEPDYLLQALLSEGEDIRRFGEGSTHTTIYFPAVKAFNIDLSPINEQRRIVAKLDALTARLSRARAELVRVPALAASLRLAALRATFHWTEAGLPAGWQRKRIDEIGSVQLGRQRSPKDHTGPHMRPYVRAANITWSGCDLSDVKEMNFSPEEFETFSLRLGDVLLNEGSGSAKEVGKPAVWKGEIEGACFQNTLLRVRAHDYLPELLRYSLLYVALSGQFVQNTKGVNIVHIGKAGLAKTVIPVPPSGDQSRLLKVLDSAFAHADRLEAEAGRASALIVRLEAAIRAKAFRGKLVRQDPNDEPASVLLDRIRAERAAEPKAKRGRNIKERAGA